MKTPAEVWIDMHSCEFGCSGICQYAWHMSRFEMQLLSAVDCNIPSKSGMAEAIGIVSRFGALKSTVKRNLSLPGL